MAGYDDPRYLRARIEELEKDLEALRKATLGFAANQRGVLPGAMRAISINDRGLASSMYSDFRNLGAGLGPYSAVTDANSTIRAEWGNLAAVGISPAQFGFRANDANGVPIFDSMGLIGVAKLLGNQTDSAATAITSTTYVVESANATFNFTLARASNVLALAFSTAFLSGAAGNANSQIGFDGAIHGVTGWWSLTSPQQAINAHFINLAAGSHTIDLRIKVDTGVTWNNLQSTVMAFLFGT